MPASPAIESGDRSHGATAIESVAQLSTLLEDTDPTLDPALGRLARRAAAEGAVLLKNERSALPLPRAGRGSVAVFGRVQLDWFAVGYGSGGDVKVPYVWNLVAALRDADVAVDEIVADVYARWCADHPAELTGTWGQWPHHFPEMPLEDALVAEAAVRAATAVVVIGRAAGEARDSLRAPGSFELTADERAMLDGVTGAFERTVVVIDAGNVMDLSWLADYDERIAAVLYAWQGGMEGARAVAAVLAGEVPASGKLTDTIAWSYDDYPSSAGFGDPDVNVYTEDVFVGYRYFETFAPDRVQFPFGFGLAYTTFAVDVVAVDTDDEALTVTVEVRNTGGRDGHETPQVYVGLPGTRLAQPGRVLAAFAKTRLLAPGESERITLAASWEDLASYDDGGVTGHRSAWVLEAGEYAVFVGTDVRTATRAATVGRPAFRVVRQVIEAAAPAEPFDRLTVASRIDGVAQPGWEPVPTATVSRRDRILATMPPELPSPSAGGRLTLEAVEAGEVAVEAFVADLTDEELATIARGDITMHSPLGAAGNAGVLGGVSPSLRERGVLPVTATDGPSGIRLSAYASLLPSGTALASTWNPALVEELAALHGQEMVRKGSDILLSPGMNIHRDPLCGRNFEYFSEDPLVTGVLASAVVRGVQSQGVAACPKHFAANNQEANRTRNDSRVSERALREIYLRGFEICVRDARPLALMTSYNKVNGVWAHYHHDLVTTVLRDEWGFDGCVVTDWWMEDAVDPDFPALRSNAYRVRAQVDVLMPGGVKTADGPQPFADDTILHALQSSGGLTRGELQRGARNVLRLVLALAPVIRARSLES